VPIFSYKGYDLATGSPKKGKIEAESLKAARTKLRSKERVVTSEIREEASSRGKSGGGLFGPPKVGLQDLAVMTRQFATLQNAHVPLDECLKAMTEQVEHPTLRAALSTVKDAVSEGKSLGESLQVFPTIFNRLYVNMVLAGEQSGSLGLVLERLADFIEYQVAVQGQIFSAMAYPGIMISASCCIVVYLFISVVPKLQKVFESLKVTLPWYTELLIGISNFIQNRWYIVLSAGAGIAFMLKSWSQTDSGRMTIDRLSLSLPLFGPLLMRINVSKFTKTLSTLLSSGVPIIVALEITRNVISNKIISDVLEDAKKAVQEGESLGTVIERSHQFPPLVVHMIKTGEKTGELEKMLKHVAEAYDAEVERKIDSLISMIEPLMIIMMGGIVAGVVVAMMMPMLSIMKQVH
jgi:general secretion pathway protein F